MPFGRSHHRKSNTSCYVYCSSVLRYYDGCNHMTTQDPTSLERSRAEPRASRLPLWKPRCTDTPDYHLPASDPDTDRGTARSPELNEPIIRNGIRPFHRTRVDRPVMVDHRRWVRSGRWRRVRVRNRCRMRMRSGGGVRCWRRSWVRGGSGCRMRCWRRVRRGRRCGCRMRSGNRMRRRYRMRSRSGCRVRSRSRSRRGRRSGPGRVRTICGGSQGPGSGMEFSTFALIALVSRSI